MNKIVQRIERELGVPGLVALLAEKLTPTDFQSLLLEVYRLRSSHQQPSDILSNYESDRFVRPSSVLPSRLLAWEQIAFSTLPAEFQSLELSPVCPLGTSSVIAHVDQNWTVATARNTEVVSDSTNVLALECAVRRRKLLRANPKSTELVHLATSHRLLRAQRYEGPTSVSHFSTFALCSAGRDQGNLRFEISALGLHIRFYLKSLRMFLGPNIPLHLSITDFSANPRYSLLEAQLLAPIQSEFDHVDCGSDEHRTKGKGYYLDVCFHLHAIDPSGQRLELVDGGSVDWTRRLLSNAKECLIISGIGSERVCSLF
jgi:hypothetical protein